jgi:hypothetical protein
MNIQPAPPSISTPTPESKPGNGSLKVSTSKPKEISRTIVQQSTKNTAAKAMDQTLPILKSEGNLEEMKKTHDFTGPKQEIKELPSEQSIKEPSKTAPGSPQEWAGSVKEEIEKQKTTKEEKALEVSPEIEEGQEEEELNILSLAQQGTEEQEIPEEPAEFLAETPAGPSVPPEPMAEAETPEFDILALATGAQAEEEAPKAEESKTKAQETPAQSSEQVAQAETTKGVGEIEKDPIKSHLESLQAMISDRIVCDKLKSLLPTITNPEEKKLVEEQIATTKKNLEGCYTFQAAGVTIDVDLKHDIFTLSGKRTDPKILLSNFPPHIPPAVKEKIKKALEHNPVWLTTEQRDEIEKFAKADAEQLLKQLAEERVKKLKEKADSKKARGKPDLREGVKSKSVQKELNIEREVEGDLNKEEIKKRRGVGAEIEEQEKKARERREMRKKGEILDKKSDEKKRADWTKTDFKREIKQDFTKKKDINKEEQST